MYLMTYNLIILRKIKSGMIRFVDKCINKWVDRAIPVERKYDKIFILNNEK